MHAQLLRELKVAALLGSAAFAVFWLGHGLLKGLMFGAAVFGLVALVAAIDHWWRRRK
jgi:predicted membrane-bound spermidine synthase